MSYIQMTASLPKYRPQTQILSEIKTHVVQSLSLMIFDQNRSKAETESVPSVSVFMPINNLQ